MIVERWREVESLFNQVVSLPARDRERLLASACSGDPELRLEVESLLAHAAKAKNTIPQAVEGAVAEVCTQSADPRATLNEPESRAPSLRPETRIGDYKIIEIIGAGGMGEVYRAFDERLRREVAIKVLPAFVSADPDRLRRFEQEARAAAALNSVNVVAVFQMGSHEGAPYLVSELLHGQTLRQRLASGPVALGETVDYAAQICAGLKSAHEKGIVHRDLKPENVFITFDGHVKILDFGLAKLLQPHVPATTDITAPGTIMGSLGYMSPEQLRADLTDQRTDIFAFGAILYEMLTGRRAFCGPSSADVISAILHHDPVGVCAGKHSLLPPCLKSVVSRCLEKDPRRRFSSVDELIPSLEAAREASGKRRKYKPLAFAYAAIFVAVMAVAASFLPLRNLLSTTFSKGARIQSIAVLPLANFSGDSSQEYFADGMTESLITDLAQAGVPRVISRTSVMSYKGTHKSLPQIAKELSVDGIVEGSVIRSAERVRVTAQLIYAPEDKHIWAQTFDSSARDVLSIESELAQSIAKAVQVHMGSSSPRAASRSRPVNPDAHDAYLRGRYFWNQRTEEALNKAKHSFEEAISKDPGFAPAYSGLADTYFYLGYAWGHMPPKQALPLARAYAEKALELDSNSAEGHTSLGSVYFIYDWNFRAAEQQLKQAIALNPNYVMAHHVYAVLLAATGRASQAVAEIRKAVEVDPLSIPARNMLSEMLMNDGRTDEAIREIFKTFELDPNAIHAGMLHEALSKCYKRKGMAKEAFDEEIKSRIANGAGPSEIAEIRKIHAKEGDDGIIRRDLQTALDGYRKAPWHWDAFYIARLYGSLHDSEHAFEWLNKAADLRSTALFWLYVGGDPLTTDPRFRSIERKMGLVL